MDNMVTITIERYEELLKKETLFDVALDSEKKSVYRHGIFAFLCDEKGDKKDE